MQERLIKYIQGTLTNPEDIRSVEEWIVQSTENKQSFIHLKNIWALSLTEDPSINTEKELKELKRKIYRFNIKRTIIKHGLKYAALIILLIGIGYITKIAFTYPVKNYQIYCQPGSTMKINMPDGSSVWLNSGSTLRYNSLYDDKNREVSLSGEGYFQIKKDRTKPFVVKASGLNIEVTGTQFNVVNYSGTHSVETVLTEGKVKLFDANNTICQFLTPNHKALFDKKKNQLLVSQVNAQLYSSWREGLLFFQNAPITEIAERLGYWYNTQIVIQDPEIKNLRFSCAAVRNKPITLVLESIHILENKINYQITRENGKEKIILTKQK